MKQILYSVLILALILPMVYAGPTIGSGFSSGVNLSTSINPNGNMAIFKCGKTIDLGPDSSPNYTRSGNYIFEGEKVKYDLLVVVPNGISISTGKYKSKVYMTVGSSSKLGNNIVAECSPYINTGNIPTSCNAIIDGNHITDFDENTMLYYTCSYSVESSSTINGLNYLSVEAWNVQNSNKTKITNDDLYYLNPSISLNIAGVDNGISFTNLKPGSVSYSKLVTVTNTVDQSSGVKLNLFMSGTDFYDNTNAAAICPGSDLLSLSNFKYYAINGNYQTIGDPRTHDSEGYLPIGYGSFSSNFYNKNELIQIDPFAGQYYKASVIDPSHQAYITYKLNLPSPCVGNFDSGQMYIWAEAI